jgi:hypothetical protein
MRSEMAGYTRHNVIINSTYRAPICSSATLHPNQKSNTAISRITASGVWCRSAASRSPALA